MIDIKLIRETPDLLRKNLRKRHADDSVVDSLLQMDTQRREAITKAESLRANQKSFNMEVANLKKQGKDASSVLEKLKSMSDEVKTLQDLAAKLDQDLNDKLAYIPNMLHETVPEGEDSSKNKEVHKWGTPSKFNFKVKDHVELGESLGILDFERATKISGARFCILRGAAARLERALINFCLDHNRAFGYEECFPPLMVNPKSCYGTGNLPKFKQDLFHIQEQNYYLVPTAEIPVTNFYADEILSEDQLPMYMTAYTPCFRSEAGSHGKDVRGYIRQHQFNKVEVVKYAHPDKSYEEHESLRKCAEDILEKLELPYRTVVLCGGDIGFGAAKCYDLEVWLPSQDTYREISSCSNFEDFQARRANIRFKEKSSGKNRFVHTLNGSAIAIGRTLIAILENFQQEDGSIKIPKALHPYFGEEKITKK